MSFFIRRKQWVSTHCCIFVIMNMWTWIREAYKPEILYYNNGKEILTMGNTEITHKQSNYPIGRVLYAFTTPEPVVSITIDNIKMQHIDLSVEDSLSIAVESGSLPLRVTTHNSNRATVAVRYNDLTGFIEYGISICSDDDTFDRKEGMKYALLRLENGFGATKKVVTPENAFKACKELLYNLADAVARDTHKYVVRLHNHTLMMKAITTLAEGVPLEQISDRG